MGGSLLGGWRMLDLQMGAGACFLTLYLIFRELVESLLVPADDASGGRVPFTRFLDSCGSEPRLC